MNRIIALVIAIVAVLYMATSVVFVVDQRHVAIVSGRNSQVVLARPGLHLKLPAPLQTVSWIDTRVLTVDAPDEDRYTTSDRAELLADPVIRYRVTDPLKLVAATKGDVQSLPQRLALLSRTALGDVLAKTTLADALAQQAGLGDAVRTTMTDAAAPLGVVVLCVELVRIDFTPELAEAARQRMSAERRQLAADERAKGMAAAAQIRADADRQQQARLAQAEDDAQSIRGAGDARATALAAAAYARDPQFYEFYQSMQAYRNSFKPGDVIVVDSSSDFFRFMRGPTGGSGVVSPGAARKHRQ